MDKEVEWIRNRATDYQIRGILNQRDKLLVKYAVVVQALDAIKQLISDSDLVCNIENDDDLNEKFKQGIRINLALRNAFAIRTKGGEFSGKDIDEKLTEEQIQAEMGRILNTQLEKNRFGKLKKH